MSEVLISSYVCSDYKKACFKNKAGLNDLELATVETGDHFNYIVSFIL